MSIHFWEEPVTYSLRGKGGVGPSRGVHSSKDRWNIVSVLCHYILSEVVKLAVCCVKYTELRDLLLIVNLFYLRVFNRETNVPAITSKSHIRLIFKIKKLTYKPASLYILSSYLTFADALEKYWILDLHICTQSLIKGLHNIWNLFK